MLGRGFDHAVLDMGTDPDTGGHVDAVLVRATAGNSHAQPGRPALIWVHGMSDYFFQSHVADYFTEQGYPFYAIDLRRCGRARAKGQRWHYTTDMAHYFPELTRALEIVAKQHGSAVIMAHSTGGLIAPLWLDDLRRNHPEQHALVAGLVLNSPWLDLQFPAPLVALARPVVNGLGRVLPLLPLPEGGLGAYGESIHESKHGEWAFDTTMKPLSGHRKYLGWLRAVIQAQREIHSGDVDAGVPTLTLVSSHSYLGEEYSPAADTADTVLDTDQIRKWAPSVAHNVEVRSIDGARHDVFLSEAFAREVAFKATSDWLDALPTTTTKPETKQG